MCKDYAFIGFGDGIEEGFDVFGGVLSSDNKFDWNDCFFGESSFEDLY